MKHHNKLGSVFAILFVIACVLVLGTAVFAQSEEAIEFDTYYSGGAQSFDTVDYYCREGLSKQPDSEVLLHVYDRIVSGVEACASRIEFDAEKYKISLDQVRTVMQAYRNDYAHHFWLGNSYTPGGYSLEEITYIDPTYLMTGATLTKARADFEAAASTILEGITPAMSEFERELLIHNRLAASIYYPVMGTDYDPEAPGNAHNAYGALVEGRAVCEGYAEALQYLLHRVGIESVLVLGESNGVGHEWNLVKIDGSYYYVDLTWNDPFEPTDNYPTDTTDKDPKVYYAYFNITTSMLLQDHSLDATVGYSLPVCTSLHAFYYTVKGGYIDSFNVDAVAELLKENDLSIDIFIASPNTVNGFVEWLTSNENANLRAVINKLGLTNGVGYSYRSYGREMNFNIVCSHQYPAMQKATSPTCTEEGNIEYYLCSCGKMFEDYAATAEITDKESVKIAALGHNWEQQTQNATYLKTEASDCRSYNEYWYGCDRANCDAISSEKSYTGTVKGSHDYSDEWTTSTTMHWHKCKYCTAQSSTSAHKYNLNLPTEYEDKYCTVCNYIAAEALGHTHSLTKVDAVKPTCTEDGNILYYTCRCEKWFSDAEASSLITDKTSVVRKATGHDYSEKLMNGAHLHTSAKNCTEYYKYWYDCANENCSANAKDDANATDKFYTSAKSGNHVITRVAAQSAYCTEEGNSEYYTCICGKWFTTSSASTEIADKESVKVPKLGHDYTEKKKDAAHIKTAAEDCRYFDIYWYDCSRCASNAKNDPEAAACFYESADKGDHVYKNEWNKGNASGHWYDCKYCSAHSEAYDHIGDISEATEEREQICITCGYIMQERLDHVHAPTRVAPNAATCMDEGNTEYYVCSCGRWFKTPVATEEITDKNTVKVPKKGHDFTEAIKDAAHLRSEAENCRYYDTYWYDCSRCAVNAKNDPEASSSYYNSTEKGDHEYKTEWSKGDASGHWHECKYCSAHTVAEAHTPDIPAPTEEKDQLCTVCAYVIKAKLNHVHVLTRIPGDPATCTEEGNVEYYVCACEKWFSDALATAEITDKDSVIIAEKGHKWTEKCEDSAHLKTEADDCRYCNDYWYDCSECDAMSATEYFSGNTHGSHIYKEEWGEGNIYENWHDCKYCTAHDIPVSHVPNIEHATENEAKICNNCGYIIEAELSHTHTPSTDWKSDSESHWHACTGCNGQVFEKASHTDKNNDAKCDVCQKELPVSDNDPGSDEGSGEGNSDGDEEGSNTERVLDFIKNNIAIVFIALGGAVILISGLFFIFKKKN